MWRRLWSVVLMCKKMESAGQFVMAWLCSPEWNDQIGYIGNSRVNGLPTPKAIRNEKCKRLPLRSWS